MNAKGPLRVGLYALPVLVVAFGVLLGASSVARALGDQAGGLVLARLAVGTVLLLIIDIIFLVGILALLALEERDP